MHCFLCFKISAPSHFELVNIHKTPETINNIQKKLVTLQRCLLFIGVIPAALQIIICLGELAASYCASDRTKRGLLREGKAFLCPAALNLISFGLLFPIGGIWIAWNERNGNS